MAVNTSVVSFYSSFFINLLVEVVRDKQGMTPTLFGRWQTRLFLLATVGVLVTLPFARGYIGPGASGQFFWVLVYVALFGLGWDVLYTYLQQFRWDRDWPGALQLLAGLWEAVFIVLLLKTAGLFGIDRNLSMSGFLWHYGSIWLAIYLAAHSLMRILFPRSRFRGGQWLF
jgi:hypothetical protein